VSTLHERLLAATEPLHNPHASPPQRRVLAARDRALRAVVELHRPTAHGRCAGCRSGRTDSRAGSYVDTSRRWPCPTIQAIAEALGVPTGDEAP